MIAVPPVGTCRWWLYRKRSPWKPSHATNKQVPDLHTASPLSSKFVVNHRILEEITSGGQAPLPEVCNPHGKQSTTKGTATTTANPQRTPLFYATNLIVLTRRQRRVSELSQVLAHKFLPFPTTNQRIIGRQTALHQIINQSLLLHIVLIHFRPQPATN